MDALPIWVRIALGIALAAFLIWRVAQRWKTASNVSESMREQQVAMRALHEQLLTHPAWHRIAQELTARGYVVDPRGATPGAFGFGLILLWAHSGFARSLTEPGITWMHVYLRGPKRIVASLSWSTGEIQIRDVAFGEWPAEAW